MDVYENNDFETTSSQPQPEETPKAPEASGTYHSSGTGRRESPYADSPYVAQSHPEYEYQPQTQPPTKPKKNHGSAGKKILAVLLAVALVAAGCGITAAAVNTHWKRNAASMQADFDQKLDAMQKTLDRVAPAGTNGARPALPQGETMTPGELYAQNVSSVVAITCTVRTSNFYGTAEGVSSGSGFIMTQDGYIVTNHHVVEDASSIEVSTHDGTTYPAKLVGSDSVNDLAVLKVEAEGLNAAVVGKSSDLVIGDMVVAIGNPLGKLNYTQTVGYVSGINREVATSSTTINMIQTDAAINPGNSGGPLFNMRGEVIGITTAKYSSSSGSGASIEGLGFAIPIDDVMGTISQLVDNGFVSSAYLNVMVKDVPPEAAAVYHLPTGALVDSVGKDGAADRAGVKADDIIIGLGDAKISNRSDLTRALRNYKAGDTTTITVIRNGAQVTMDITLDERPPEADSTPAQQPNMPSSGNYDEWYNFFRDYFDK